MTGSTFVANTEKMASYVPQGPSPKTRRQVNLLEKTLPLFPDVLNSRLFAARSYSERRSWTTFLSLVEIMRDGGAPRFDKIGDPHAAIIERVLEHLEDLICIPEVSENCEVRETKAPRLLIIHRA